MPNNRILIADDEADLTEVIGAIAEDIGFQVTAVHEGSEVVSRVSAVDPAVIMLDLRMPGTDGVEVLNRLSEQGSKAGILLMSGLGQSTLNSVEHVGKEKNLNVIGSLTKPLTPDEIEAALKPLLPTDSEQSTETKPAASPAVAKGPSFGLQTEYLLHAKLRSDAGQGLRATLAGAWILDNEEKIPREKISEWARSAGTSKGIFEQILRDALCSSSVQDLLDSDLALGINFSVETLQDENTVEHLSAVIESCSFPFDKFVLEIDVGDINRNYASAAELLSKLRIKGFCIAVVTKSGNDDLLAMIDKLPMDEIIVDLGWLENSAKVSTDMELEYSYSSLASVANKKGVRTCADNVNSDEILEFVKRCDFEQARGAAIRGYEPISEFGKDR